jgi:enoyl-CoA hydratase
MADPAVIVENEGPTLLVTLNRPEKKNAVNCEVMCRLYDAWVRLDEQDELRVAILTGRGDTFCAGMDLSEIGKMRAGVADNEWMERVKKEPQVIFGAWLKTYRPTKPVILAAEGCGRRECEVRRHGGAARSVPDGGLGRAVAQTDPLRGRSRDAARR